MSQCFSMPAIGWLRNGPTFKYNDRQGLYGPVKAAWLKQTGNGHREGGWEVYDFYSETKTIYVDYSGTLQRAQIDTESSP